VHRTGNGLTSQVLGGRTIERMGDSVCGLYRAQRDEECRFLGPASKSRLTVCQWVDLKIIGMVFSGLASKPLVTVFFGLTSKSVVTGSLSLTSKPVVTGSPSLTSKLVAWVSRFGPQNW
jgi:hypothetical protein